MVEVEQYFVLWILDLAEHRALVQIEHVCLAKYDTARRKGAPQLARDELQERQRASRVLQRIEDIVDNVLGLERVASEPCRLRTSIGSVRC